VFVRCPSDVTVTEGEDASFECQLETRPAISVRPSVSVRPAVSVSVSWYKDEDLIPADDDDFKQSFDAQTGTARLYISGTYLDDAGVYTCTAITTDRRREASVSVTLVVNGQQLCTTYYQPLLFAHCLSVCLSVCRRLLLAQERKP